MAGGALRTARATDVASALLLMLAVWSLLLGVPRFLGSHLGRTPALFVAFLGATGAVLAARSFRRDRPLPQAAALLALGLAAGFASLPAWSAPLEVSERLLGPSPIGSEEPLQSAARLVLAPVFEEVLYRERLLLALRGAIGALPAAAGSSLLFAIPHLDPWLMLATALVGLALAALMEASRSVALCIGFHMGLNAAATACGVPPTRFALPAPLALAATSGLLAGAVALARSRGGAGRAARSEASDR